MRVRVVLLGVVLFGVVTLGTSGEALTPLLLFDGPSYVAVAQHIREHWFWPPPSLNLRAPLYPAVIAVAGWLTDSDGLAAVVHLQILAWLLIGPLVALWVYRVGGSLLIGGVAGCLYYTLGESFLNVGLIYAETITVALAVAAGLALSSSMLGGPHGGAWRWLAAALALATAYARPIYQILLPLLAAFAVGQHVRRWPGAAVRHATPFVVAGLIGLLPVYLVHAIVKGVPAFVPMTGHSLANYLGDRRLLGKFPAGFEDIESLYATRFAADPGKLRIGWWEVADDWARAVRARTGQDPGWGALDRDMGTTAVAVLRRNPEYYVRRWLETWREFSTSPSPPVAGRWWCPVNLAHSGWALFWAYLGAGGPFAILAIEVANAARRGRGEIVRLVPIVTYLSIALANTAIEPWPGQVRYRSQVEVFLVIALGLMATLIRTEAGAAAGRWRPRVQAPSSARR